MNEVKVWCEKCSGTKLIFKMRQFDERYTGFVQYDPQPCEVCQGKGYTVHSFGELAHDYKITLDPPHDAHFSINERDRYDITDAQADAAVLDVLSEIVKGPKDGLEKMNEIKNAIADRLHSFYCGRGAE